MNRSLIRFYYYKIYWFFSLLLPKKSIKSHNNNFTIGVTTFLEREAIFRNLLKRLVYSFPDTEIVVAINGHYNPTLQKEYLNGINDFCIQYPQVKTIQFLEPQGLSKLWNKIIISSASKKIFLFNDDILFKRHIQNKIVESGILNEEIALIDDSFSHFLIDKKIIKANGWFDERFTEIGGEDDDFHVRLELKGIPLKRFRLNLFSNYKPPLKVNSYGNKTNEQEGGYSTFNSSYLLRKWKVSNEPFDGAVYIVKSQGNYWRLKEDMETPNFYENLKTDNV